MNQDLYEWLLIIGRWVHITTAVTWIGTSIFFMWLDRSFKKNLASTNPAHLGELWMVHGGGFYHVEKMSVGKVAVPSELHWFKWESYFTWMSGAFLLFLIFYMGDGTYLLDDAVSNITYFQGVMIGLSSIFLSWFIYDFVWERKWIAKNPMVGNILTLLWFIFVSYFLCHTLSGRAAYIHLGAMIGTWMSGNVFLRIIPRQVKMIEAAKRGEVVNEEWSKNAKFRSTHNTYLTLPIIFIMLSNHFPSTYGHDLNYLILILLSLSGACMREFFVKRIVDSKRALKFLLASFLFFIALMVLMRSGNSVSVSVKSEAESETETESVAVTVTETEAEAPTQIVGELYDLSGIISFKGQVPQGKKLKLPAACNPSEGETYSDEVRVKEGKLENVLVRVIKGHEQIADFEKGESLPAKILDQKGCIYHPRVLGLRVGQKLELVNSDPVFHNVRAISKNNDQFNLNMPKLGQREIKTFSKPELFLQTKCSLHPWMKAHVAVMDHPYFAVSDERGEFLLRRLPVGKYTLEFWHETLGTKTQEIEVTANSKNIEMSFGE